MRSIINISLPQQLSWAVDKEVKSGAYATKSEFFRYLLRLWFEGKMLKELNNSRVELQNNKGKLLNSLKDLR